MVDHADPEFFNPAAHVRVQGNPETYRGLSKCACSWVGVNFDMHLIAMHTTYDVLVAHEIQEEN